jgi:hypothetical protein
MKHDKEALGVHTIIAVDSCCRHYKEAFHVHKIWSVRVRKLVALVAIIGAIKRIIIPKFFTWRNQEYINQAFT